MAVENAPRSRPFNPARWNIVGTLIGIAGYILGPFAVFAINTTRYSMDYGAPIDDTYVIWGHRVWSAFGIVGMVAAITALARREALWGFSVLALCFNGIGIFRGLGSWLWYWR